MPKLNDLAGIAVVILAAGQSRRMGDRNKLLAPLNGKAMIQWSIEAAMQSRAQTIVVVTGHQSSQLMTYIPRSGIHTVYNPEYMSGMASSLCLGIEAVEGCDAALVMLGDMPFVTALHLNVLIERYQQADSSSIVVPVNAGRRGNPVLWPSQYFTQIRAIKGDKGARDLLKRYSDNVICVDIDQPVIFWDVDTPEALLDAGEVNHLGNT